MSRFQAQQLEKAGTRFLRQRGFTWAGRPKRWSDPVQCQFERRFILAPVGTAR